MPLEEVDKIAKMIPGISGKPITINGVLTDGDEFSPSDLRQMYEGDPKVRALLDTAMHLEGVARHSSIHPAAVVVADRPLPYYTPLMRPPQSGITANGRPVRVSHPRIHRSVESGLPGAGDVDPDA